MNQIIFINLFKSGNLDPVDTVQIDYTGSGSVQWVDVDWKMSGEGAYYVCYNQANLAGYAVNGVRDYSYGKNGKTSYPSGRYFKATSFGADVNNNDQLWDLKENKYTVSTNYGLNFCIDARCDYSDFIIDQSDLFKTVIAYQVGINLLRELAFNPDSRVNRNESNIERSQILYEIDGDTQGNNESTLFGRLKKALNAISFDDTGIDKICLPCKKRSVRFKAMGPARS